MTALIEELLPICRTIRATGCAGRWRSCGGAFRSKGTMWLRERRFNWCIRREWNMATSRGSFQAIHSVSNFRAYSTKAIDTGALR